MPSFSFLGAALSALALLASSASCAKSADLIKHMPGFGVPPTAQYSGFLEVDEAAGTYFHYLFVTADAENAASKPVTLWLNGGPGCSSLDGYFYEHGPFSFTGQVDEKTKVPTLKENPYSWHKLSNMLYLESPSGVGFSFSRDGKTATNDTETARHNLLAVKAFFKAFPEYAANEFFIAGESYAGVYVPTLAAAILDSKAASSSINLKGILVGNGCTGTETGSCSPQGTAISVEFLYGHGLFSQLTYKQIEEKCPDLANPNEDCNKALAEMSKEISDVNVYNIYDECVNGGRVSSSSSSSSGQLRPASRVPHPFFSSEAFVGGPDECIDATLAAEYLDSLVVREALHVSTDATPVKDWTICSSVEYTSTFKNLPRDVYPKLIDQIRVQIFNGDVDACVPYNGNEEWTRAMGYKVSSDWQAWKVDHQVAGYITQYDVPTQFAFITVKGAGHMVAQYRPSQAFALFSGFVHNTPLVPK